MIGTTTHLSNAVLSQFCPELEPVRKAPKASGARATKSSLNKWVSEQTFNQVFRQSNAVLSCVKDALCTKAERN